MKTVVTALLFLAIVNTSEAYPISPRPLRKLIIESDNIIIGYVDEIKTVRTKTKRGVDEYSVAVVRILQLLKGTMEEKVIEVSYDPSVICPAPPFYMKSTHVVLFLSKHDKGYSTYARSYGAKTLDSAGVIAYRDRIIEMSRILTIKDVDRQFMETLEWLVKCAENPTTRWEGTYELSPESDFMSYYDRNPQTSYRYMISPDQKSRLKNALLSGNNKDYTDYNNFGIIDLLYAENKEEIFKFLSEGLSESKDKFMLSEYMRRICLVKDTPELKQLLTRFEDIQYSYKKNDEKEMDNILKAFKVSMNNP